MPHPQRFVGRQVDLGLLGEALGRATPGPARFVTLHGPAGIGKTRLLDEAIASAADDIDAVAVLCCSERPLGPYVDLRRFVSSGLGARRAAEVLPQLDVVPDAREVTGQGDVLREQHRAFAAVTEELLGTYDGQRLVLAVDDLHWCHPSLLAYVEFLVDELATPTTRRAVVGVLATRPLPPDHPAAGLIERVERSPSTLRLDLAPLDEADEAEVVRLQAGDVSRAFLGLVHRSAGGNPLHIRTTVEALRRRGVHTALRSDDPRARGQLRTPSGASDPVTAWLAHIDPELRQVLSAGAVMGGELHRDEVAAVAAQPPDRVERQLFAAVDLGILATDGTGLWFAHPSFAEVLYDLLPALERRALHARCVEVLATLPAQPGRATAIGHHLLQAGDLVERPVRFEGFRAAGDESLQQAAWMDAAAFYAAAEDAADGTAPAEDQLVMQVRRGLAHFLNHDAEEAVEHLRTTAERARQLGDEAAWATAVITLTRVSNSMVMSSYRQRPDTTPIEEYLAAATDPRHRADALGALAETYVGAGRAEEADEITAEALRLARRSGDARTIAVCAYAQSYADMSALRIEAAVGHGREALRWATQSGDWWRQTSISARVSYAVAGSGDLEQAERLAREAAEGAAARHEFSGQALGNAVRGAAAVLRGDLQAAGRLAAEAARQARRSDAAPAVYHLVPLLAAIALQRGEPEEAIRHLDEWPSFPAGLARTHRNLAALALGDRDAVDVDVRRFNRRLTWLGAGVLVADAEVALALGDPRQLDAAREPLGQLFERRLEFTVSHPLSVARLLGDVLAALDQPDEARNVYDHAVAVTRRAGAYAELARALVGSARVESRRRSGSPDRARQLAAEAVRLAQRLGLADSTGLTDVAEQGAALARAGIDEPALVESRGGGWCTVLVTDVAGSTDVSREHGDLAYYQLVSEHHDLVRSCVGRFGGQECGDAGDGLLVWFTSTEAAVEAAVAIQDAVVLRHRPSPGLRVKIGLAGGEPLFREGRPFGLVLNRAARVVSLARPGEILADAAVGAEAPASVRIEPYGSVDLRGIGRAELVRVLPGELGVSESAPPRSSAS